MKFDAVIAAIFTLFMCLALGRAVMSVLRRSKTSGRFEESLGGNQSMVLSSPSIPVLLLSEDGPRCLCGDIAVEPMPSLVRSRGKFDFLRKYFAAPPRYVRHIDPNAPRALCRVHAHVADAKMDEFLFNRVRGIFAEANARVAVEAASFEREVLLRSLTESLTDGEKKAVKKMQNGKTNGFALPQASNGDGRDSLSS